MGKNELLRDCLEQYKIQSTIKRKSTQITIHDITTTYAHAPTYTNTCSCKGQGHVGTFRRCQSRRNISCQDAPRKEHSHRMHTTRIFTDEMKQNKPKKSSSSRTSRHNIFPQDNYIQEKLKHSHKPQHHRKMNGKRPRAAGGDVRSRTEDAGVNLRTY